MTDLERKNHFPDKRKIAMLKTLSIIIFGLYFLLPMNSESAPPIPARIGGTITVDAIQLTQSTDTSYKFIVTRRNGTQYEPAAQDIGGLNAAHYYVIDIQIYDKTNQSGGAKTGDTAAIHVYKDGIELLVTSPGDGEFTVGQSGSTTQVNLEVTTNQSNNVAVDIDGDVAPLGNRDAKVDVGDALVALRFALGLEAPTKEDTRHGDVAPLDANGKPDPDGQVTVGDSLVILRKALGIITF